MTPLFEAQTAKNSEYASLAPPLRCGGGSPRRQALISKSKRWLRSYCRTLAGIFGFSGIAGLRSFIEARGWKTYFSVAVAILGAVAQFFLPEIVTPERLALWLSTWGIITQATLTHARHKEIRAGYIGRIGER